MAATNWKSDTSSIKVDMSFSVFLAAAKSQVSISMNHSTAKRKGKGGDWMRSINALIVYHGIHCGSHKNMDEDDDALSLLQDSFYDSLGSALIRLGRMYDQQIYSSSCSKGGGWSYPYPISFERPFCKYDVFPSVKWIVVLIGIIGVRAHFALYPFPPKALAGETFYSIFSIKSSSHIFTTGESDSFVKWLQWPKCKVQNGCFHPQYERVPGLHSEKKNFCEL